LFIKNLILIFFETFKVEFIIHLYFSIYLFKKKFSLNYLEIKKSQRTLEIDNQWLGLKIIIILISFN
jgi:hypothetical protein